MKTIKKILVIAVILMGFSTAINAAGVYGTIDLSEYNDDKHDLKGNTLAILLEMEGGGGGGGGTISNCTIVLFDKKANEKIRVVFPEAIGNDKVDITYFDKTWALLKVSGADATYYSVKLGKTGVTILGSILDSEFRFRFASGKNLVSVLNQDNLTQLFNQKLEEVGTSIALIGKATPLNSGKYFRCEDGTITKIYKIKKGFEEIISETGDFKEINELKRICCIKDGDSHKICKY